MHEPPKAVGMSCLWQLKRSWLIIYTDKQAEVMAATCFNLATLVLLTSAAITVSQAMVSM